MLTKSTPWELALDQAGSADARVLRRVAVITAGIVVMASGVLALGAIQLPAYPQFSTFHAGFVFLLDGITGFVLLGQFRYRRLPFYAILAGAYLFSAVVAIPFILSFPGALKAEGGVIGGVQSSIWVWHFWHILFPSVIVWSLLGQQRPWAGQVAEQQVTRLMVASMSGAVILAAGVAVAVTEFHDSLPVLITPPRMPLPPFFYVAGGLAAAVTAVAAFLALAARVATANHSASLAGGIAYRISRRYRGQPCCARTLHLCLVLRPRRVNDRGQRIAGDLPWRG